MQFSGFTEKTVVSLDREEADRLSNTWMSSFILASRLFHVAPQHMGSDIYVGRFSKTSFKRVAVSMDLKS